MNTLLALGLGQGITLSMILFFKSAQKKNSSWIIGILVFCISAIISGPLLNSYFGEPNGSFLVDPLILLIGPCLYGYILSVSNQQKPYKLFVHTIPFFIYIPLLLVLYFDIKLNVKSPESLKLVYSSYYAIGLGLFKFIHLILYLILGFFALRKHVQKLKRVYSNLEGKDLKWLKYLLLAFIALSIVSLLIYVFAIRFPDSQEWLTLLNLSLLAGYLVVLTIYSLKQENIFDASMEWLEEYEDSSSDKLSETAPKYEKSGLKNDEIELISSQLDTFIEKKDYLNPEVTLSTLSNEFGVPAHKISEVLGKHKKTSFYDLINYHRIEDIKVALNDPKYQNLSVLGIAFEFGYNSKSTFNSAFKKFCGMSPSEFRKLNS